jgi:DNA polymerase III alpha subunit
MNSGEKNMDVFVVTRSFLAGNIEVLLENLSVRREAKKIDSEDLFNGGEGVEDSAGIPWNLNFGKIHKYDILLLEKESLGIYVSGNPLKEYEEILDSVRHIVLRDDIFLVLIEKAKKIFTRNNSMMFALQITLPDDEKFEGIIFPKIAPSLSPKLEEKQLYWVKGKITSGKKKKPESNLSEEVQGSDVGPETESHMEETKEYEELPKLIIENLVKFEEGVIPLFEGEDLQLTNTRQEYLATFNWQELKEKPGKIKDKASTKNNKNKLTKQSIYKEKDSSQSPPIVLKLKKSLGTTKLKEIKSHLTKNSGEGTVEVKLEIENGEGWKKVKGTYWVDGEYLRSLNLDGS